MPNTLPLERAGQKRKRATNTVKYYSVRIGHKPGIYYAWPDCQEQITGFKGAQCETPTPFEALTKKNGTVKSFTTLSDAESFMRGIDPTLSAGASPRVQKFYAVRNGRKPGIYLDWPSAQQQITNWTRPQYKSFLTRAEAEAFIKDSSTKTKESPAKKRKITKEPPSSAKDERKKDAVSLVSDHMKKPLNDPARNVLSGANREPSPSSDLDSSSFVSFDPEAPEDDGPIVIYTDGSALGNGKVGSVAGVGVYFGPNDSMNVSEPLAGSIQTNNRAELTAIIRAVELAPKNRDILIKSDSRYSIDCYTNWYRGWTRNNWLTAGRKPVENRDLIELGREKIEERDGLGVKTSFEWLRGHANEPGNEAADRLAVAAAELAKRNRTFR